MGTTMKTKSKMTTKAAQAIAQMTKETKPKASKKKKVMPIEQVPEIQAIVEVPEILEAIVEIPEIPVIIEAMETKHLFIGDFVREAILAEPEKKNKEILAEVLSQFVRCKTTYACIAWYRSKLRKEGMFPVRSKKEVV